MAVHKEPIDFIEVYAPQHSADSYYRVCYGEVDWREDGQTEHAIYVLMRYGTTINYRRVAHILTTPNPSEPNGLSDLDKVLAAIQKLKARHHLD
ncbi:hypothetical protein [Desertibacillus haloalkaliphilus]|uniref:hypothetical protein n=1 Tax=Desertibacillus haloalkaliphilus TaxID=1328930 RepID=UPI001C260E6C|nr:hypothetical protein [Desertibacillus haloalkaliphilus]MBU8906513.1 hypothetical protein [Desertibacillus haloalkaliphilus]